MHGGSNIDYALACKQFINVDTDIIIPYLVVLSYQQNCHTKPNNHRNLGNTNILFHFVYIFVTITVDQAKRYKNL